MSIIYVSVCLRVKMCMCTRSGGGARWAAEVMYCLNNLKRDFAMQNLIECSASLTFGLCLFACDILRRMKKVKIKTKVINKFGKCYIICLNMPFFLLKIQRDGYATTHVKTNLSFQLLNRSATPVHSSSLYRL